MFDLIFKILRVIKGIPQIIKKGYKLNKLKKLAIVGENLTISHSSDIRKDKDANIIIGNNCDILAQLIALEKGVIHIGNNTTIRANSKIGAVKSITIGNNVIISNNVHIYDNNNHPTSPKARKQMCESGFYGSEWSWSKSESAPVTIEDNVWIGERSTILKGVTIGIGSIIGCDSVVTKSIPPYCIAAGNPAKVVKTIDKNR